MAKTNNKTTEITYFSTRRNSFQVCYDHDCANEAEVQVMLKRDFPGQEIKRVIFDEKVIWSYIKENGQYI